MFLSVSMPVYNAEKYLQESISSVIAQRERDFELILVDDGSKDDSVAICEDWASRYPDIIRVVRKENSGSLMTRRRCLEESRGDYIYIMDADDVLTNDDMFGRIKSIIADTGCDLVFFNATKDRNTMAKYYSFPCVDGEIIEGDARKKLYEYMLTEHGFNTLWNKVFSRNIVDWDADYEPYAAVSNGTDFFQSIPIMTNAKRLYFCDEVFYFYRVEQGSASIVHKFRPTIYTSGRQNFLRLCDFSEGWGLDERTRLRKLRFNCMRMISTSAYKARLIKPEDSMNRRAYLKTIGEDELLKRYYSLKDLPLSRRAIIIMLRAKMYGLLATLLR